MITRIDGYDLGDVAKEIAMTYGGMLVNWYVKDDKLQAVVWEDGDTFVADLPLNEVKEFMEM